MNARSGIYSITNTANGHRYIGSAVKLASRWRHHQSLLRNGIHNNAHLQRAWNLYGEEVFRFEVLEECEIGQLIAREQWWMDAAEPEYNICKVAGSCLGLHCTEETRIKISAALMGHEVTTKTRAKIAAANAPYLGRKHTAESRAKMRGREVTAETRAKLSVANTGKKHTAETRAKLSTALRGRKLSEGHKAEISASMIGKRHFLGHVHTPETRAKMSAAHMGHEVTAEARANMSVAAKRRYGRQ